LIEDEMKQSFLDYSMSVIVQRALPDVRDGLKPVHRRILFSMHETGLSPSRPFKKSATVVGDVLGKYHPHGDSAVYDAMVRMVQDFSLRYPLISGQGNFGSIDGDSAAAYRYTEAKLAPIAMELLADIEKQTVEFTPNFDDRLVEPVVLPSKVPNLLINGSSGIAVGMSTNIPPHNISETIRATLHLLDYPDCDLDALMQHLPGPDFPTGGLIVGRDGIRQAYETGRGRVVMQGRVIREIKRGGREQLVITEIPYATSKTRIIEQIADLTKKGKAPDIYDLRDESDRDGIRLVVELKKGADAKKVVRSLFKWTALQSTFGVINLALDAGAPKEFTLKQMLERFRDHRIDVIVKRSKWERGKAIDEAHVLEGLLIALKNIERVVAIIRSSRQRETAAAKLRTEFKLTEVQAEAILMMRLYRLTQLEARELRDRLEELQVRIRELDALLADPALQVEEIRRELKDIAERFGDPRRTRIIDDKPESLIDTMVAQEDVIVTVSHAGFVKQIPMYLYRRRMSTGKAVAEMERYGDDYLEHVFPASTTDPLIFFTESGQAFTAPVSEIPEADRGSRGRSLHQLLALGKGDRVLTYLSLARHSPEGLLLFVTEQGFVKRTPLDQFGSQRAGGVNAINLRSGDRLVGVHPTDGGGDLLLVGRDGRVIRFSESDVPEMGRATQGVRGMRLDPGEVIVGSAMARRDGVLVAVTDRGFARKLATSEIPARKRDGRGVVGFRLDDQSGKLIDAREVASGDELMLLSPGGVTARLMVDDVSLGRPGDAPEKVVSMPGGARVAKVTRSAGGGQTRGSRAEARAEAGAEAETSESQPPDDVRIHSESSDLEPESLAEEDLATGAQYDLLG